MLELMRLAMIISSLVCGGAQHSFVTLANHWSLSGWEVHVLCPDLVRESPFFPIDSSVKQWDLRFDVTRKNPLVRALDTAIGMRRLREYVREINPHLVISFLDWMNSFTLISTAAMGVPVIISERMDPRISGASFVWHIVRPFAYCRAKAGVAVSNDVAAFLKKMKIPDVRVIPGPIDPPRGNRADIKEEAATRIMSAGRFAKQKGFDLLIKSFKLVAAKNHATTLTIWGAGPEQGALQRLITDLDLEKRVTLPGVTREMYSALQGADIFVLSSRFEGYPRVLAEAMMLGLPVVSFDCVGAPADMIEHMQNGLLVPAESIEGMSSALQLLLSDSALRKRLGQAAPAIAAQCGAEVTLRAWSELVQNVGH